MIVRSPDYSYEKLRFSHHIAEEDETYDEIDQYFIATSIDGIQELWVFIWLSVQVN